MRLRMNSPQVISETIQGETIVIHLTTGTYYSLQGTGAEVWDALNAGASVAEAVDGLAAHYEASREEIDEAVAQLVRDLRSEDLVADVDGEGPPAPAAMQNGSAAERKPFAAPRLEKFTDMQDLVLLDPVHEVDPRGWPHAKVEA
jgi:Coenzyme PQQ synthesis protein D (PqqD)